MRDGAHAPRLAAELSRHGPQIRRVHVVCALRPIDSVDVLARRSGLVGRRCIIHSAHATGSARRPPAGRPGPRDQARAASPQWPGFGEAVGARVGFGVEDCVGIAVGDFTVDHSRSYQGLAVGEGSPSGWVGAGPGTMKPISPGIR